MTNADKIKNMTNEELATILSQDALWRRVFFPRYCGVVAWASEMRCSKCGFLTKVIEGKISQYNFCPSCGADMRPREENNNEN